MHKIYKSVSDGNFGIQKSVSLKDFKGKVYTIWRDEFSEFDFVMMDDTSMYLDLPDEFKTEKEAYEYLEKKFGKLRKLSTR